MFFVNSFVMVDFTGLFEMRLPIEKNPDCQWQPGSISF
jgi:hypothetical protein